jgi:hypothetical protein
MLVRWMRQVRKLRPWMVAVALATGSAFASCDSGGDDDRDVVADTPTDATDGTAECTPAAYYGPQPPCTTDLQCVTNYGVGWYCDDEPLTYDNGCGEIVEWGRICVEGGAADADADADIDVVDVPEDMATYYGPPPADADTDVPEDMATFYGPPPADGGGDADLDSPTWYGPPPTDGGADADDDTPSTFYGPIAADADADAPEDGGPATFYGPMPVDGG